MIEKNVLDIFNISSNEIDLTEEVKRESNLFNPDYKGDKPYEALVRFLPIPTTDESGNLAAEKYPYYVKKWYFLKDEDGVGYKFDSPSSIGERCPIQSVYFALDKSNNVRVKNMAGDFKMNKHYWSLLYIIDDKQNPDNNGKVKIWRYSQKMKDIIFKQANPPKSSLKQSEKVYVWDLFDGKDLILILGKEDVKIGNKLVSIPNYDECEFDRDKSPITIYGHTIKKNDSKSIELINKFYKEMVPDISIYKYKPYDQETKEKLDSILKRYKLALNGGTQIVNKQQTRNVDVDDSDLEDSYDITSESDIDDIDSYINDVVK